MRLMKKTTYPSYTMDILSDVVQSDSDGQVLYQTHSFDKAETKKFVKKWRKDTIQSGDGPLWGLMPLHKLYYHINESKIPATTCLGLNN